ncbi:MAG TPA: KH domain-containing protein [Candidatus Krumholzibacteriaceae bacterium]|nr:KH domain-containing protein [Candidatus Krumholzibacteriaceae bacterium]
MSVDNIKTMVHDLAAMLVDEPKEISITEEERNNAVIVVISVAKDDVGKIIGKNGQTAKALRALVNAASTRMGEKVLLEIRE